MDTTARPDGESQAIARTARVSVPLQMIEEWPRRSGYLALRDVACRARDDAIYLDGRVPSYFLEQIAQEIVADVEGVRRVINRNDVSRSSGPQVG